jgi:YrbI family 3-deoxy-D-manno-octulosonate 8-phosphate phosphatase
MFQKLRTDLTKKLFPIKLLLVNADGFLRENQLSYQKRNPRHDDGYEVRALRKLGVFSVAFSTKNSEALCSIADRLGMEALYQDVLHKSSLYSKVKFEYSVSDNEIAFVCGDSSDLSIIEKFAFSVAPADAPLEVKARSYYVTYGVGEEAMREVAELILKAKNRSGFLSL